MLYEKFRNLAKPFELKNGLTCLKGKIYLQCALVRDTKTPIFLNQQVAS
jgi:hypothetical protein